MAEFICSTAENASIRNRKSFEQTAQVYPFSCIITNVRYTSILFFVCHSILHQEPRRLYLPMVGSKSTRRLHSLPVLNTWQLITPLFFIRLQAILHISAMHLIK